MALTDRYPNLAKAGFRETSPAVGTYNCIAWASERTDRILDPFDPYSEWPDGVPRDGTIDSLVIHFTKLGYEPCSTPDLEPGIQKVAIYALFPDFFDHAAIQLPDGKWSSKMGIEDVDIEHNTLEAIVNGTGQNDYGRPRRFLKKARTFYGVGQEAAPREAAKPQAPDAGSGDAKGAQHAPTERRSEEAP